jgi:hypothetical protein
MEIPKKIKKLLDMNSTSLIELCKKDSNTLSQCLNSKTLKDKITITALQKGDNKIISKFYDPNDSAMDLIMQSIVNNNVEMVDFLIGRSKEYLSETQLEKLLIESLIGLNMEITNIIIDSGAKITNKSLLAAIRAVNIPGVKLFLESRPEITDEMKNAAKDTNDPEMIDLIIPLPIFNAALESFSEKNSDFDKQVSLAANDLKTFNNDQLKILKDYLRVYSPFDRETLCNHLARKILYAHADKLPEDSKKCNRYISKLSPNKLKLIRNQVYETFKRFANSVTEMTISDLHDFFNLYDQLCFKGDLSRYLGQEKFGFEFRTTGEPTFTTTGICLPSNKVCDYTITIPIHFFEKVKGPTNIAGDICNDQLECLQRVIEHEMVHLVIFMFCGDRYITDQHGELFMKMVKDLFGHTDYKHYLF